jgi:uncharacterized DUF497 family protein
VFFIRKRTNEVLILSARDMDEKERKSWVSGISRCSGVTLN